MGVEARRKLSAAKLPCPLEETGNPPSDKRDRQITVGRLGARWGCVSPPALLPSLAS